ncbi:MAG: aminopeptidase [Candidatus Hadarchaeia archaeon]
MDKRIREHAKILVNWSTEINNGENVLISASEDAKELVVALYEEIGKKGANPITLFSSNEAKRRYLKNYEDEFETPDHLLSLSEKTDATIMIKSDPNLMSMNDVPGKTLTRHSKAREPVREEFLSKKWCLTQHPTNAQAQMAEMSLEEYKDFVYDAILRDWKEVHKKQEILKKRLDQGKEVRIEGPDTDITMSIDGMLAENSDGKNNMPSGEVFTAPVVDSVEGRILFDKPLLFRGTEIEGVELKFENGKVTNYDAKTGEDKLGDILEADEGSKRIGELGIGTNRGIDRFTKNMLFDEKMGETIHMALGRAYEENIGEGRKQNKSAIHVDIIKDMGTGKLELDGEPILKDGKFPWD